MLQTFQMFGQVVAYLSSPRCEPVDLGSPDVPVTAGVEDERVVVLLPVALLVDLEVLLERSPATVLDHQVEVGLAEAGHGVDGHSLRKKERKKNLYYSF